MPRYGYDHCGRLVVDRGFGLGAPGIFTASTPTYGAVCKSDEYASGRDDSGSTCAATIVGGKSVAGTVKCTAQARASYTYIPDGRGGYRASETQSVTYCCKCSANFTTSARPAIVRRPVLWRPALVEITGF